MATATRSEEIDIKGIIISFIIAVVAVELVERWYKRDVLHIK